MDAMFLVPMSLLVANGTKPASTADDVKTIRYAHVSALSINSKPKASSGLLLGLDVILRMLTTLRHLFEGWANTLIDRHELPCSQHIRSSNKYNN